MGNSRITRGLLGFYGFDKVDNGDGIFYCERKCYLPDDKVFFEATAPDVHGGWLVSMSESREGWNLYIRPFKDRDKFCLNEIKLSGTLSYDLSFEENEREKFEILFTAMTGIRII